MYHLWQISITGRIKTEARQAVATAEERRRDRRWYRRWYRLIYDSIRVC
jgi:hypothetical protein